ncbi:hypothetical protein E2320_016446, partial [Naja naja]
MDPREMSTGAMRQRSSQEQARGEEETQILNGNEGEDIRPGTQSAEEKGQLLKKKVFVPQRSLVDMLLEVEHFCTIHHIFVAILCIFVLKQIISCFGFQALYHWLRQLPTALFAWLCMFLYTSFVPYQALQIWSGCLKMTRFPNLLTVTLVVVLLLCHAAMLGFFPIYIVVYCNLGIASIRFLMKSYSFLRESMPPLLHARDEVGKISPPEFSTYLYFLFCPTLIYRKSYPRSIHPLELCHPKTVLAVYIVNFLMKYYFIPNFSNMHKHPFTIKILLLSIFDSCEINLRNSNFRTVMDPREMSTGAMRQRSSQEQAREKRKHKYSMVMKAKILDQVHNQLSDLLDKTLEEAAHSRPQQLSKGQLLKKKVFVPQRSLVDMLLEVEHFCTIHHIFVAILCIFVLKQIIVDSIDEGRLVLDFKLFIIGFRQLPTALFAWLCMFLYTSFVPYQALQIWSGCLKMTRFPNLLTVTLVVVLLLCHAAMLGFFPIYIVVYCNLGIASRKIVLYEQIRFLMKSYSFLRESMPPLLHARDEVGEFDLEDLNGDYDDWKISPPEFSTYLYFLFCPTLIYRKSYPRDPYIRWSYVIQNWLSRELATGMPCQNTEMRFLACIYFLNFILKYYVIPNFSNMHKQPFTIKIQLLSIFDSALPGILLRQSFFLSVPQFLACIYFVNFLMKYYFIPNFSNMHKQPFTIKILLLSIFD